jgi:MFS family permease
MAFSAFNHRTTHLACRPAAIFYIEAFTGTVRALTGWRIVRSFRLRCPPDRKNSRRPRSRFLSAKVHDHFRFLDTDGMSLHGPGCSGFTDQVAQGAVFVHLIPYLIDLGIDSTTAASTVSFIALASTVSRYGFGWLSDRFSKKRLLIILFIIQPIAIFLLMRVRSHTDIIPFLLLYSVAYGGTTVLKPIIIGDYYGRKNYGTIFGFIQGLSTVGGIAGPLMIGFVYDINGSYHLAFLSPAIMLVFTALLISFLKIPSMKTDMPPTPMKGFHNQ